MALDQKPCRAAAGIVDLHARLRFQDASYEDCDFPRRVKLPGCLSLALGEFSQQVLVGPAEYVRLHVLQAKPVAAQGLDQGGKAPLIHDGLTGSGFVEVLDVYDALELGVLPGHGPDGVGEVLSQARGLLPDPGPPSKLRDVEVHRLAVLLGHECGKLIPEFLGQLVDLILEHVREPLEEDERQYVVLEFGGV